MRQNIAVGIAVAALLVSSGAIFVGISNEGASKIEESVTVKMLETTGFQMPSGASEGYVLTSDAYGIGTWRPLPANDDTVDGEGQKNYVAKFLDHNTIISSAIYETEGNVGIGTTTPSEKLQIAGNVDVSSNRINNYYGFPRPDFDTGWMMVTGCLRVSHYLGGNPDNYVVDIQEKDVAGEAGWASPGGISNMMIGGDVRPGDIPDRYGFYYCNLDDREISICSFSPYAQRLRVRIWVYD